MCAPAAIFYLQTTLFVISSTLFAIVQMKTLQQQLRTIADNSTDHKEIDKKLNNLIQIHSRIIKFVKDLDDLMAFNALFELLTFGIMMVAILFLLNTVRQNSLTRKKN